MTRVLKDALVDLTVSHIELEHLSIIALLLGNISDQPQDYVFGEYKIAKTI